MASQIGATTSVSARLREVGMALVSSFLCATLAVAPALAEAPGLELPPQTATARLSEDQKVLHALNRFTFGPKPGQVQEVEKMGLRQWFEQQLNPQSLPDMSLNAMLARFPAMQLTQQELMEKFPAPQMLRQMAQRGAPLPADPVKHAIYADAMLGYERQLKAAGVTPQPGLKRKDIKAGAAQANMDGNGMSGGDMQVSAAQDVNDQQDAAMTTTESKGKVSRRAATEAYSGEPVATILALPPDQRMAKVLAMSPEQALAFRDEMAPRERLALLQGLSPEQIETVLAIQQNPVRVVGAETLETRLLRDVYSDRQLEAVMTDFWLNHFNVYVRKNQNEPYLLPGYERDVVRPRALGKFEDLLVATAESPAMLMYLDNWQSIGPHSLAATRVEKFGKFAQRAKNPQVGQVAQALPKGINENYARELMELHTLGVRCEVSADKPASSLDPSCGRGYTQADVTDVAKVLTGWTIDRPYRGGGGFVFEPNRHEPGTKHVLGTTIHDNGQAEGLQVLHMLATSPATAHFLSEKLAVRFVSDDPPQALVDRMATTFLKSGGDIKAVLRTLFDAPEFWTPTVYRAKVKTPLEFVASALRASDANVANPLPLVQALDRLGMPLYGMQTPNGYSWKRDEWVSTAALVTRMNFALVFSGGLLQGTRADWPKLLGETSSAQAATANGIDAERKLEMLLIGQPVTDKTRSAVLEQGAKPGQVQEAQKNFSAGLDGAAMQPGRMADEEFAGKMRGRRAAYAGGPSMTALAGNLPADGPVTTMAGLLLGSPEFQRR